MKEAIKRIPFIGKMASKAFRMLNRMIELAIKRHPEFTTSAEYWENRYRSGGGSGAGSYSLKQK